MNNLLAVADWSFGLSGLDFVCSEENLTFRKQVIYEGNHPYKDDSFDVDEDLIDHWVNTNSVLLSKGVDIPLPPYHTNDSSVSQGSITKFEKARDSLGRLSLYLSGNVKSKSVLNKLKTTCISLFSPAVAKIGKEFIARPILHACTTDRPVIKGLESFQLALSYSGPLSLMEKEEDDKTKKAEKESSEGAYCSHCGSKKGEGESSDPMKSEDGKPLTPEKIASKMLEMEGDKMPELTKSFMEKIASSKGGDDDDDDADDGNNKKKTSRLLSLSLSQEQKDIAIRELAEATGQRVALVEKTDGLLILAESELTDDLEPYAIVKL